MRLKSIDLTFSRQYLASVLSTALMENKCIVSGKPFTISDKEIAYCQARNIPLPKIHPNERLKRVLSFRNRTFLYNTQCAFSKEPILSCISPDTGFTIYDHDIWNSEQWDPLSFGIDYNPNQPFWEQFKTLFKKVPLPNLTFFRATTENSEYINGGANLKNCYLTFASTHLEDCLFCWNVFACKNVVNCISAESSELCYQCRDINHCYRVQYAESSSYCSDSFFLESCQSCSHCYGCVNLNHKEYYWYNEPLTKNVYEQRLAALNLSSYQSRQTELAKFTNFKKTLPRKYQQGKNNEHVTGNYVHNSKDCTNLFHSSEAVDVENSIAANKCTDSFGTAYCISSELVYNAHAGISHYNIQFCGECIQCRGLTYCLYCVLGCSDCFGCVGLKKKQYCILNKQYSQDEYHTLVAQIKQQLATNNEWDEYFPKSLSPHYYNYSDAMIIFPMSREQALAQGYAWKDEINETGDSNGTIPDTIQATGDEILQTTLLCEQTGKKYRVVKAELAFYRAMDIPVPHRAPLVGIHNQAAIFAIDELKEIACSNCKKNLQSVYDPTERPVLCEECYLQIL